MIPRLLKDWRLSDWLALAAGHAVGFVIMLCVAPSGKGKLAVVAGSLLGVIINVPIQYWLFIRPPLVRRRKAQMLRRINGAAITRGE